jgi:hypothetical protein
MGSMIRNTLIEAKLRVPDVLYSNDLLAPLPSVPVKALPPALPEEDYPLDICLRKVKNELLGHMDKMYDNLVMSITDEAESKPRALELSKDLTGAVSGLVNATSGFIKETVSGSMSKQSFYRSNKKWASKLISMIHELESMTKELTQVPAPYLLDDLTIRAKNISVQATHLIVALRPRAIPFSKTKVPLEDATEKLRQIVTELADYANNLAVEEIKQKMAEKAKKRQQHIAPFIKKKVPSRKQSIKPEPIPEPEPKPKPVPEPIPMPKTPVLELHVIEPTPSIDPVVEPEDLFAGFEPFSIPAGAASAFISSIESLAVSDSEEEPIPVEEPVIEEPPAIVEPEPEPEPEHVVKRTTRAPGSYVSKADMRKQKFEKMQEMQNTLANQKPKYAIPGGFSGGGAVDASGNWRDDSEEVDGEPVIVLRGRRRGAAVSALNPEAQQEEVSLLHNVMKDLKSEAVCADLTLGNHYTITRCV